MPGPITVNVVPWTPLEREAFDRHLNEETAERLWAEVSKIKERQPDDAKGWRVRFADRPDLVDAQKLQPYRKGDFACSFTSHMSASLGAGGVLLVLFRFFHKSLHGLPLGARLQVEFVAVLFAQVKRLLQPQL